jgi:AcrR family transcriptional regulator
MDAGAEVLARKGYEGATVAEVARHAGVTSGAIYAHYQGKSDLLSAVVAERGGAGWEPSLGEVDPAELLDVLELRATGFTRPASAGPSMLIEAVVAAKRDPAIAETMRRRVGDGQERLVQAIGRAQEAGPCDPSVSPVALARLALILALGARLVRSLHLPDLEREEWADLVHRIIGSVRSEDTADAELT